MNNQNLLSVGASALLAIALTAGAAKANLVTNGDFSANAGA